MIQKIKYISLIVVSAFAFSACDLETEPTDKVSGPTIFESAESASTAINGAYALLYRHTWITNNYAEGVGFQSNLYGQDVMADDVVLLNTADWFCWDYDYRFFAEGLINSISRNHNMWNQMYEIISNLNYIIAEEERAEGNEAYINIMAQAYAYRAFCYFELIQVYQHTYIGHENDKGVPIYTEPSTAGQEGKPREPVSEVYTQINKDITRALELFDEIGNPQQKHPSHIDFYVTKAIEARVALVQNRWGDAYDAAAAALSRSNLRLLNSNEISDGMSKVDLASTIWGMEVQSDQGSTYNNLYTTLDPRLPYGERGPQVASAWLYDQIRTGDKRKDWFDAAAKLQQVKRLAYDLSTYRGDYIWIRAEEMLLIQAEAEARRGQHGNARSLLKQLAAVRFTDATALAAYESYVDGLNEATELSSMAIADTNTPPRSVLEEVILQRRIELWAEIGRIKDILRLKQGFDRDYSGTNHTILLRTYNTSPESPLFLYKIPQIEFDGNESLNQQTDQNPWS